MYFLVTKKQKTKTAQSCHALVKDSPRIQPPLIIPRRETSSSAKRSDYADAWKGARKIARPVLSCPYFFRLLFFFQEPDTQDKERR